MRATVQKFFPIVVVGGGAGGLELVTALARAGRRDVLLLDCNACHVWKPRLHEMAAGLGAADVDEISYATVAEHWGFSFRQGALSDVSPQDRTITVGAVRNADGAVIVPEFKVNYDALVLALGGVTPDLGVDGVHEHSLMLDDGKDAEEMFVRLSRGLLAKSLMGDASAFEVVIAGSGSTGVELASHLIESRQCNTIAPRADLPEIRVTMLEATDEIMPGLSDEVRRGIRERLEKQGVQIETRQLVSRVTECAVETDDGASFPSDLTAWTTGTVGPRIAEDIAALDTNEKRQWVVKPTLQTFASDAIFALGDCAAIKDDPAPPTAQAASEQAAHLARYLPRWLFEGQTPAPFEFRNKGTVLSLGDGGSVAKVRTRFTNDFMIGDRFARAAYRGLYRQHQFHVLGPVKGTQDWLADILQRGVGPRLKVFG